MWRSFSSRSLVLLSLLIGLVTSMSSAASPSVQQATLTLPDGHTIEAQVRFPDSQVQKLRAAKQIPTPVFIILGGFENAGEVLKLIHSKVPYALATFDYPFSGSRSYRFPDTLLSAPKLKHAMQDTQAGIHSLVEYLKTQKRIDPSQIGIIGASFGAPFALDAAARNSDIHTIAIVHGFADVEGVLKHRLRQILEKKWGILSNPASFLLSKLILLYLNPPDITQAANQLRPSQRVLIIEAKNDRFIPLAVREQLWNSLSESNASIKRVRLPGDHLQPGTQDQINEMIKIIESWQKEPTR